MAVSSDRVEGPRRADGWRAEAEVVGRRVGVPVLVAMAVLTTITAVAGLLVTGPLDAIDAFDQEVSTELVAARTPALDRLTAVGALPADTIPVAVVWVAPSRAPQTTSLRWWWPR